MRGIAKIITITYLILMTAPLSTCALSLDDIFDNLDEFLSGQTNENGDGTQVINKINVSADTGGNKSEGGEIIEGESKTKVEIKNVINGQEIEPVKIETKGAEVNVESEIKVEDGKAQVSREIEIDSEKQTENYEINLENDEINLENASVSLKDLTSEVESEIETKGLLSNIQNWWSNLVASVKSFLEKLF